MFFLKFYLMFIIITSFYEQVFSGPNFSMLIPNKVLLKACEAKNPSLKIIKFLVERKADINNSKNYLGEQPLYLICKNSLSLDIIKYLIENNADVNDKTNYSDTPLHQILTNNSVINQKELLHVIKYLIAKKAKINKVNFEGKTPLLCAYSSNATFEVISFLINNNADVNSQTSFSGENLLHWACKKNVSLKAIKLLFLSFIDKEPIFAFLCSVKIYSKKLKLMIPRPIVFILLTNGIFKDTYDKIKQYFNKKYYDWNDRCDKTALDLARDQKHNEIIDFLNNLGELLEKGNIQGIVAFLNSKEY